MSFRTESRCSEAKARRREKSLNRNKILIFPGMNMACIFINRFLSTSVAIAPESVRNDTTEISGPTIPPIKNVRR